MIGSACSPRRHESAVPGWCTSRPHATMQSDALARERRPPVGTARRRRAAGRTPSSGAVRLSAGTPAFSVIRTGARYTPFAALRAAVPGPTGRTAQRSAFPCLRAIRSVGGPARRHESAVPGWCTSRPHATMQSDALARERRPPVGTARRRRAAGKDPEFRSGSPLGRDPGVERHPDGCVAHAFRCASRSGAGPHRENCPEVGVPVPARHPLCWGPGAPA